MSNSSTNEVLIARSTIGNSSTEEILIEDISSHHDALIGETLMKLQNASTPEEIFETGARGNTDKSDDMSDDPQSDVNGNEIEKSEKDASDDLEPGKELHVSIVKASIPGAEPLSNDQSKVMDKEKLLVNILNIKDGDQEDGAEGGDRKAGTELVANIIKMMVC